MPSRHSANGRSFADLHPDLVEEWDLEANLESGRTPQTTTPRSSFKASWICRSCGNKWKTSVNSRTSRQTGCPICAANRRGKARQKPPEGKSLAELHPLVSSNWHPDLNGSITPFDVFPGSEVDRWWKCSLGHVERTPPKRRSRAAAPGGCTTCGGRRVEAGFNDLATTHPHIAAQWDTARNSETGFDTTTVSSGSERSFWWICSVGHRIQSPVKVRVKSAGCPQCSVILSSRMEIELRCEFQAVGIPVDMDTRRYSIGKKKFQLDICAPEWNLVIEFDGRHWHKDAFNRDLRKTRYLEKHGWTVIRIRDMLKPVTNRDVVVDSTANSVNSMVKSVLERLQQSNFYTPQFEQYLSSNNLWAEMEANRRTEAERSRSLLGEFPEVAAELDEKENNGLRPEGLHPGSNRPVKWRCSTCGHSWTTSVNARTGSKNKKGTGCPQCAAARRGDIRRIPLPEKSLADLYPELAAQWDTEKNDCGPETFRPFTATPAWWICPDKGHSYETVISSRTAQGSGCVVCAGKQVLAGYNDLATTHPELLALWDYDKNSKIGLFPQQIMAGSEKRGFWLCAMCRCSLESKIYSVMHGRHHCWKCGVKVRSEQKKKAPFERSLSFLRPDLLEEWDEKRNAELGLFPDAVFAQSHSRANWNCKTCGHIWETKIQSRFLGGGCPKCRRTPSKKIGVTDRVQSKSWAM